MKNLHEEIKRLQNQIEELESLSQFAIQAISDKFGLPLEPSHPSNHLMADSVMPPVTIRIPVEQYVAVLDKEQILVKINQLQKEILQLQKRLSS